MKFRPCIDIHNGKVKQIVGGSLADSGNAAKENFVSDSGGEFYARLYKERGISGGHIILLNAANSEYYEADKSQAFAALEEYPNGLQLGGGITAENTAEFLDRGASHVIVTSYVFRDGTVNRENLKKISAAAGRDRLVIDLSCRKRGEDYYIVTDRWQKFTDVKLDKSALDMFAEYCSEFLIHAVDVEGKASGIEVPIAEMLGNWNGIPVTYAGGIGSYSDLDVLKQAGKGKLDFTVGSALDIFGGSLDFEKICSYK
ncbi:MAG: phosphoribosylformimino-5-aminoimidazole carboxamide ribotide isomerase [Oscillospiraceae bacterium]|nr:phosphoribosylformimino-5-aminoimidazole carboxamide ribotide isomerase [Oscillospiraceae bacterium]